MSSIYNWEHGVEPELQYNPSIIKFRGYIPFDCPDDTVVRAASRKCLNKGDLEMSLAKHFHFADHISDADMVGDLNLFLSQVST